MNRWYQDPRTAQGEADAFEAEREQRRGHDKRAAELWAKAGEAFAAVAKEVDADHPVTRSDLEEAARSCFARLHGLLVVRRPW